VTDGGPAPDARGECPRCQGTGFVHQTGGGREYARRCGCRKSPARPREPLESTGIPASHRHCTLGNFEPRSPALSTAYDRALAYSQRWTSARPDGLGLLFWGPSASGKTHLAAAILAELAANGGVRGRFWTFGRLLDEIMRSFDAVSRTGEPGALQAVLDAELVVLDDLGARKMSDWAADTLFTIVNGRYMARRPTLITTAYEDVDRDVALQADARRRQEFLIERLGPRLRSRLLEMCAFVPTCDAGRLQGQKRTFAPSTLGAMRRGPRGPA
jgi:DNA replication protein DnaC